MTTADRVFFALKFFSALGCGLIAGVFFAFSTFVMNALARLNPAQGISAMKSINLTAINPLFMTALFGTGASCLFLAGFSFSRWQQSGSGYLLAGSLLYLAGVVLVTIICNVPLNDQLAIIEPGHPQSTEFWASYLSDWTKWNHVRTAAAFAAAALFTLNL